MDPSSVADLRTLIDSALRNALDSARRDGRRDQDVRVQLRPACDTARAHGLRVEQLIVVLKERWRMLPEARAQPRPDRADLLSRVVTACVEEYYADHASAAG